MVVVVVVVRTRCNRSVFVDTTATADQNQVRVTNMSEPGGGGGSDTVLMTYLCQSRTTDAPNYGCHVHRDMTPGPVPMHRALKTPLLPGVSASNCSVANGKDTMSDPQAA